MKYVVASSKTWFKKHLKSDQYKKLQIIEISSKNDLNTKNLKKINPRYIFFPHWSWKINTDIYNNFECIGFHTSPLPFGRGGSPIQNLIVRGVKKSPLCAFKITDTIDGGPIYDSIKVSLDGTIDEIFSRIAVCVEKIIIKICNKKIIPKKQNGRVVLFKRLKYEDNELKSDYSIKALYDRVRMVDGLDYSKAFINFGKNRIEFTEAKLVKNKLEAKIIIKKTSKTYNKS